MGNIIVLALTAWWLLLAVRGLIRGRYSACTVGFFDPTGSITSAIGNERAAQASKDAANKSMLYQIWGNWKGADAALKPFQPWQGMENQARTSMGDILGYNGQDKATAAYTTLQNSPAYQFRLNQGVNALDRSASASGGLFSGNAGRALTQYGQDLGSEEFNNEYNRRLGMMNWAYGNAANRANIQRSRYTGQGDIMANYATNVGANQAALDQYRGGAYQGAVNGLWGTAKDAVNMVSSLYGGGNRSPMAGMRTSYGSNPYGY